MQISVGVLHYICLLIVIRLKSKETRNLFRSSWHHLRVIYSLYLMPVFAFAAAQYPFSDIKNLVIAFIAIHVFLYPAANGFHSWFDKRAQSHTDDKLKVELLALSGLFILAAFILGWVLSFQFAVMILLYCLVSTLMVFPGIRLKRYGFFALVVLAVLQGGFTYIMATLALHNLTFNTIFTEKVFIPAILCTVMMLGFIPMTQIYQHAEDAANGDKTASMALGLNGTFIFSAIVFLLGNLGFYIYFINFFKLVILFILFQVFLSPLFAFFILWYFAFQVDKTEANHRNAMILNKLACGCLLAFFAILAIVENWY